MNRTSNNHFAPSRNADLDRELELVPWYFRSRTVRLGRLRILFCSPDLVNGFGVVRVPGQPGIALVFGIWNVWFSIS